MGKKVRVHERRRGAGAHNATAAGETARNSPLLEVAQSDPVHPVHADTRHCAKDGEPTGPSERKVPLVTDGVKASGRRHVPARNMNNDGREQASFPSTHCLYGTDTTLRRAQRVDASECDNSDT
jgi:hypothetical protein